MLKVLLSSLLMAIFHEGDECHPVGLDDDTSTITIKISAACILRLRYIGNHNKDFRCMHSSVIESEIAKIKKACRV